MNTSKRRIWSWSLAPLAALPCAIAACAGDPESETTATSVEALRASPPFAALAEPVIARGGAPIFLSNNPEIFTSDGVLGGTVQPPDLSMFDVVTGQTRVRNFVRTSLGAADPTCPGDAVRRAELYLYHDNRSGAAKSVHVLVRGAGAPVNVTFEGNLNTRSLPGGGNPFQLGNSISVNTAQQRLAGTFQSQGTRAVPAEGFSQVGVAVVADRSPIDGYFSLRGNGCFFVQVVASTNASDTSAARTHMADGEIRPPGPGILGRASGLYQASVLSWTESKSLAGVGSIWGYKFDSEPQMSQAHAHYADSDADTNGNYGVFYQPRFRITNDTGSCRRVSLRLAAYPGQKRPEEFVPNGTTRFWDGPARFLPNSGSAEPRFLQTTPQSMQPLIVTGNVAAGQTIQWGLDLPVPGLISIPAAFLLEQDPC
jgi:hypothetical protein